MTLRAMLMLGLIVCSMHANAADFRLEATLSGLAAECRVIGAAGIMEAQTPADVDDAFKQAAACVDSVRQKGKAAYRAALDEHPDLKQEIGNFYAAWLGYIDDLRQPQALGAPETEPAREFTKARHRIQAVLDAR